jgi:hypothetical protein
MLSRTIRIYNHLVNDSRALDGIFDVLRESIRRLSPPDRRSESAMATDARDFD